MILLILHIPFCRVSFSELSSQALAMCHTSHNINMKFIFLSDEELLVVVCVLCCFLCLCGDLNHRLLSPRAS